MFQFVLLIGLSNLIQLIKFFVDQPIYKTQEMVISLQYQFFCQELKQGFENDAVSTGADRLLLTAAVGMGQSTVDAGYDVPTISQ